MTSQRITYVLPEAIDEACSPPLLEACDAHQARTKLCMVQTDIPGRQAVATRYLGDDEAHTARVLETTVLDCAWQDSDDPDLLARWNSERDGGLR